MLIAATALMSAVSFADDVSSRRGPFAFHYGPSLTGNQLAWYSQFDLLVTHDPLPRAQRKRLHAAGTRLLLYEWSVAFYDSRANDWQRSLLLEGQDALLNRKALVGGVGSATSGAWYFDPASPEHEMGRATELARHIKEIGYDGVFFDTTTVESVHPEARKEYERRHPGTPYDQAFSRFLFELRRKLPNGIIFTNQGYRSAESYLPYADWDLTESLITFPRRGSHQIRPWNDPADPWNSIHFLMRTVIEPVAARYPHVRFGHLNYIQGSNPETVRLVMAVAQIFGGEGFVAAPAIGDEVDGVYVRDPGKPLSPRMDSASGKATYRFFEHGLIVITAASEEITIENRSRKGLRDSISGQVTCGAITIPL